MDLGIGLAADITLKKPIINNFLKYSLKVLSSKLQSKWPWFCQHKSQETEHVKGAKKHKGEFKVGIMNKTKLLYSWYTFGWWIMQCSEMKVNDYYKKLH